MLAVIRDNHFIYLGQITQGSEDALVDWFSVRHPRSYYIDTNANWDGWYRRYNTSRQRLALPFLNELKECCKKNDIPLEIVDERDAPKYPVPLKSQITETFIDGIKLETYQLRAAHAFCDNEIGIVDASTGSGKSELICCALKMFRCPTLVLTEQIVVLDQIVERIKLRNVVYNDDVGKFCYGETPDDNLVMVGSIQSLSSPSPPPVMPNKVSAEKAIKEGFRYIKNEKIREIFPKALYEVLEEDPERIKRLSGRYLQVLINAVSLDYHERYKHWYSVRRGNSKRLQDMAKKCDLLIIDECDKCTSNKYSFLFTKLFNGRRRYGFSGTPFDSDKPVQNLLLKERLGSVICKADRSEVQAVGRIIPIEYIMIAFGEDGDRKDSTAFDIAEREILIENEEFHNLIFKIVSSFKDDRTLILVDTIAIEELGHALEKIISNSKFIYGQTPRNIRREYIKLFEDKKLKCLIGGKILKRGLDLKCGCDNLVLVGGGKLKSDFDQKIGRALRLNERGYARVFDFLFLNNKYLYGHSRIRLKTIVGMGYKSRVIIGGNEVDGKKLVDSKFRIRKSLRS